MIGSIRRECLDHVIPLSERHLRTILAEYVSYYNRDRPHRTLRLEAPQSPSRPRAGPLRSVHARPVLGGLHHVYDYAALTTMGLPSHSQLRTERFEQWREAARLRPPPESRGGRAALHAQTSSLARQLVNVDVTADYFN